MKRIFLMLILTFLLWTMDYGLLTANAAVPHLINYQGRLTDTNGSPLNGSYSITFRIYDAESAGNLLWQGTYASVSITKGIFNILLGDVSDTGFNFSNLAFDKPYWLEIKVGTDAPMAPRQRITSAGYAISAERLVGDEPLPIARGGTGSTAAANTANGVVVLDVNRKLPAVDGSQLTDVSGSSTSSLGTSFVADTVYQNTGTKKILIIASTAEVTNGCLGGYAGPTNNPTTKVAYQAGSNRHGGSITFICPPNWYWKVTSDTNSVERIEVWEI